MLPSSVLALPSGKRQWVGVNPAATAGQFSPPMDSTSPLLQRDKSWLAFNHRVLLEAGNPEVPLLERLRFLAIFSSNLDEFFRVRVAGLHALREAGPEEGEIIDFEPTAVLEWIRVEVDRQHKELGSYFLGGILPGLRDHGILFVNDGELDAEQAAFVKDLWERELKPAATTVLIEPDGPAPFLHNRQLYLIVVLETPAGASRCAFVEIPTQSSPRFIEVPARAGECHYVFLDDIVRRHLPELFEGLRVTGAYAVKLTRDAKLHLEDEHSGDLLEKIRVGVSRRARGTPSRFLYDPEIPAASLEMIRERLGLRPEDLVPGWRYHNFSDFFTFANPGIDHFENEPLEPLRDPALDAADCLFDAIDRRDRILFYPYHTYDHVIRFLNEAAHDPAVTAIDMTLYRIAKDSLLVHALAAAARNGKKVTAFVEMKARFDEESNLSCANELESAGARVVYRLPGLKVHSKLCLVARTVAGEERLYAYLATGNFNEKTARVYTDYGLFTADLRITRELRMVCDFVSAGKAPGEFKHLLVAPFNMRERFVEMLDDEIRNARAGKRARVILKLNNLEDPPMIRKLTEAAAAGVEVRLVVRTICRLPLPSGNAPEPFTVTSIVDRFLEHGRVYIFHNGGDERVFMGSADWMTRNLSRRVEVVFPIYDEGIRAEIRRIIDTQLSDNTKARVLDCGLGNRLMRSDGPPVRSQMEIYQLVRERAAIDVKA
jgi:polyphosphate kinase